jgi:N-formylmaleamate deformylase
MIDRLLYGANLFANGIRQHYLRYGGRGRPIVIVPGITSPAITWGFVAQRLARSFDVHVLDVRGRGLSQADASLDYSLDTYAGDVQAFVQGLDLSNYILLGHSMGGRIGIRLAHKHGGGLARLVLVDPPVSGPGRRPFPVKPDWFLEAIRLARAGTGIDAMRRFQPSWSDQHLQLRAEWLHTCDDRAILETCRGFDSEDIHADLPLIRVPTLLVTAGKADVVRENEIAELRALMPSLQAITMAGAGHMIPWDDFDGFFAAIEPFLAGPA